MQLHHRYEVGQQVHFRPGPLDRNVPRGIYKIERLLPSDGITLQYRVKNVADGHERVVPESQLSDPATVAA